jgi:hypothetical protein
MKQLQKVFLDACSYGAAYVTLKNVKKIQKWCLNSGLL